MNVIYLVVMWGTIIVILTNIHPTLSLIKAPHIPNEAYIKSGDLDIGALYPARQRSGDIEQPCAGKVAQFRIQQHIEAVVYTIDQINSDQFLLPNVTLGYVILDDCRYSITSLAKSIRFLPFDECAEETCNKVRVDHQGEYFRNPTNNAKPFYNVVGVVGPTTSPTCLLVSNLLGIFHVPVVSPSATSDELTNSFDQYYFFRVVPPDRFQAEAMVAFLHHYNWTYVSVLYTEGSYGTNLFNKIQKATQIKGICIGYFQEISQEYSTYEDFIKIIKNLRKNSNAKVVILVLTVEQSLGLFSAVKILGAQGEFIWFGSESVDSRSFANFESEALGAFSLALPHTYAESFAHHFRQLNPINNPTNPWYRPLWENMFGCTWDPAEFNTTVPCELFRDISQVDNYYFSNWTSRTIDAVLVYAHALHELINDHCSHAVGNKIMLQHCVTGPLLRDYLQHVSFPGASGHIEFDSSGDLLGNYDIKQLVFQRNAYEHKKVGIWQSKDNSIKLSESIRWYTKGYENLTDNEALPLSVCSLPCIVGQVAIPGELPCCWHCRTCRDNEIASENASQCIECPYLTWPDVETQSTCLHIVPSYLKWSDLFGVFLIILDTLGFTFLLCFTYFFVMYRHHKVIKASSIPLTIIIFMGLYLAFMTSFIFKARPETIICSTTHFGSHLSCTLIYATLFVKTSRIYRIFQASKKCRRPRVLMDIHSQIGMVIMIVVTQFLVMCGVFIAHNISAKPKASVLLAFIPSFVELHMPVRTTKFVELRCNRPMIVLLVPLCFNIFLLLLCAVFAFLTRQLPDGFNESWYIFLSVTTTLIIWMAFIPTYFLTFYARYKEALLSLALALNAFCNLLVLFSPKIYALFYVEEDQIQMGFDDVASSSRVSNKNLTNKDTDKALKGKPQE